MAQRRLKTVPQEILDTYVDADRYFMIHENDPDLQPVKIWLPKPPPIEQIDNYGLPAKEQFFKPAEYPPRLRELERGVEERLQAEYEKNNKKTVTGQKILTLVNKTLNEKRNEYLDEIKWVYDQIFYINNGYWVFINGKPTFIDGWHYEYTNFFNLDIGLPDYRDRDRRWFIFARDCYTTTTDHLGIDKKFRTCYGFTYPKHRRDGATYKCLCIGLNIIRTKIGGLFGIQSFNDDNAGEHFREKLIPAWQKSPFFLKPMWDGSNDPADELSFKLERNKVIGKQLQSRINYATTAHRSFYDGKKQMAHLSDENGKTERENILVRHGVVKETLSQGKGSLIHGFSMHPTTVADLEDAGGNNYKKLCEQSKNHERNSLTGQTKSGLRRLFIPAFDGLEGFIGPYGESIIDDPNEQQAEFIGREYGAREFIVNRRKELKESGTAEDLITLREETQLYPICYADCFRMMGGDIGFDIEILDESIEKLESTPVSEYPTVRGNFVWLINSPAGVRAYTAKEFIDNEFSNTTDPNMKVIFQPCEDGNFELSYKIPEEKTNQKFIRQRVDIDGSVVNEYCPTDINGIINSADPFHFLDPGDISSKVTDDKDGMSKGAGGSFWKRDINIDPPDKPMRDWESQRFICTYLERPPHNKYYAEEMLMMTVYTSGYMFPENNIPLINEHFYSRGYAGFLMYKVDIATRTLSKKAGFSAQTESKNDLFLELKNHIRWHGHRERHMNLLKQWREIRNKKQMTHFDLVAMSGGCMLGAKNPYDKYVDAAYMKNTASSKKMDISLMYGKRKY